MLTLKQTFHILLKAIARLKAGNSSENLLNEIRQITYSFYWANEITEKVYDNVMN